MSQAGLANIGEKLNQGRKHGYIGRAPYLLPEEY
jgi:hypothetical protein